MGNFLRNLAFLVGVGVVLFIVAPDAMKGVFQVYNGLGILPIFILLVVIAALPSRKRSRHR